MQVLNVFPEWFLYGESDLFFFGIGLLLVGLLLPWHKETQKRHLIRMATLLAVYLAAEALLALLPGSYLAEILLVLLGGGCLAVAAGRLLRCLFECLRKSR